MSGVCALNPGDAATLIPISEPILGKPEEELVLQVLRSGRLAQGPMVERFEEAVQAVVGTPTRNRGEQRDECSDRRESSRMPPQALGATIDGRPAGSFGTGCFSFYATKNITTGEGGVVTTDDQSVAETARVLRNQGQRATYDYARPGYNLRMTDLQAAIGGAQMARLPDIIETRRANAGELNTRLAAIPDLITPRSCRAAGTSSTSTQSESTTARV